MSAREGSYALGATQWQTIWHQVLPSALPGILTGLILAMSRAIGETARHFEVLGCNGFPLPLTQDFTACCAAAIHVWQQQSKNPQDRQNFPLIIERSIG